MNTQCRSWRWAVVVLLFVLGCLGSQRLTRAAAQPGPAHVELVRSAGKWQLLRNGQSYQIKGAGGDGPRQLLVFCGGNSLRTWDAEQIGPMLDEAQRLGLTVAVGLWLGHERHGFDYTNREQLTHQRDHIRAAVLRYRGHPAVLLWGVGNEMEGFQDGSSPVIWSEVNRLAAMIKTLDPHHPTMTVTAEIGGGRVRAIHRLCPDIDIVGINSYAGVASLPQRYRKAGGTKPYIVTEFACPGFWEVPHNAWGVAEEPTSTRKAESYRAAYQALVADDALCLGSYAFIWGHKLEATATWFGMFLPDGAKLEAVDALTALWSGRPSKNRCPRIERLSVLESATTFPGTTVRVQLQARHPAGNPLRVTWRLTGDTVEYPSGGDAQPVLPEFPAAVVTGDLTGATVRMPEAVGLYRLYVDVHDNQGSAATGNVALRVSEPPPDDSNRSRLPLVVVGGDRPPYAPSGWMGNTAAIGLDPKCTDQPRAGKTCFKCEYSSRNAWGGVVWQNPPNDWGERVGGFDLTGATQLSFWARGKDGGEKVKFGFGVLGPEKPHHDTATGELEVTLRPTWTKYELDLRGKNLARIKTGFFWSVGGQGHPVTFYLDDVRYQ